MPKIIIDDELKSNGQDVETFGIFELSTDEQIAKKIFQATGDKLFKGFLPTTWNTSYVVKMRAVYEELFDKYKRKPTALEMAWRMPEVSKGAHDYFLRNAEKIRGWMDKPSDLFKPLTPLLWIAGIGVAAYFIAQVKTFIPKAKQ